MLKRVSFFEWHHLASARGGRGVIAEIEMNPNANDSKGECWSNQDETIYVGNIGPASGLSQDPHTREGRREALEQMEEAKAEQLGLQEHLRAQEHQRRTALDIVLDRDQAERDLAHLQAGQRVPPSTPSQSQTSSKRLPPEPVPENHDYDVGSGTARERDQEQRRLFRAVSAAQQQLEEAQHEVEKAQQLLEVGHPQIKSENFPQPANEEKERLETGIVSAVVKGNGERDGRHGPRDMSGMSRQEWALKKLEAKRKFEHDNGNEAGAGGTDFQKVTLLSEIC